MDKVAERRARRAAAARARRGDPAVRLESAHGTVDETVENVYVGRYHVWFVDDDENFARETPGSFFTSSASCCGCCPSRPRHCTDPVIGDHPAEPVMFSEASLPARAICRAPNGPEPRRSSACG
ncbi:hypothetical protein HPB50_021566 [Hyalomma asiaticum]|uniref:Uncharacterized protein n=1 Tax=Hyalomma asiaticum TaxID=266040 RepID=A0ACB7T0C2_HYAAI|nr:hypothetical protein HPB50_021566 [Hyalomma asiaticum]